MDCNWKGLNWEMEVEVEEHVFFRLVVICISDSLSAETGQLPYAAYTFTLGPIEWPS